MSKKKKKPAPRAALLGLGLLAHAGPNVGVDGVGVHDRARRVEGGLGHGVRTPEALDGPLVELVAGGMGDDQLAAHHLESERQRTGHVVGIAERAAGG